MTTKSDLVIAATVKRPEELAQRPTVSLFVLAKNAESCIGRLLENVGPYIDEVVVVLNDTTDDSKQILETYCKSKDLSLKIIEITSASHPWLYILDTQATYDEGESLAGEAFNGPFTEKLILANWAAVRNLGWDKCTKEWRLFLDADDVVLDPESIPGLCRLLEDNKRELACTKYHFHVDADGRPLGSSYRERLAKNDRFIRWVYPIHECLAGATSIAHVDGNLIVRDMRDNMGSEVRIPGRNFKILYHYARKAGWRVGSRMLVNLIMEVRHMTHIPGMMSFATHVLTEYLKTSVWPEERGWAIAMVGEMKEKLELLDEAADLYWKSLNEHPGAKTAFRLCRANFSLGNWKACIAAYDMGADNKAVHQVLDDGPLYEDMSKILVATAHHELGHKEEALKFCDAAVAAFPANLALGQLRRKILGEVVSELDGLKPGELEASGESEAAT